MRISPNWELLNRNPFPERSPSAFWFYFSYLALFLFGCFFLCISYMHVHATAAPLHAPPSPPCLLVSHSSCFTHWTQPPAQEWKRGNGRNVAPRSSQKHETRKAEPTCSAPSGPELPVWLAGCCRLTTYSPFPLAVFWSLPPAALQRIRVLPRCLKCVCVCACYHSDPFRQHRLESCLVSTTTVQDLFLLFFFFSCLELYSRLALVKLCTVILKQPCMC